MRIRPVASASFTTRSASSTVSVNGFSTKTSFPARSASIASSAWVGAGVATTTASIDEWNARSGPWATITPG